MSNSQQAPGRRRSSVYNSLVESLQGRNSISNFASSYSRSSGFWNEDFDFESSAKRRQLSPENGPLLNDGTSMSRQTSYGAVFNDEESSIAEPAVVRQENISTDVNTIPEAENTSVISSVKSTVLPVLGKSTAPQTIFNGINTLIGIGILSLPLGISYAGWVLGSIALLTCAVASQCTAKLLAKCLLKSETLKTYGDIAYFSYGRIAHLIVVSTFTLDLLFAGVSMIILFADSFSILTGLNKTVFKCAISILFFLASFVRLDVLSNLSLIGIISTTIIVFIVLTSGIMKKDSPGSLIETSPTSLWPMDFKHALLSFGIFMSPFGGHAIFPELYRDMHHPHKYNSSCSLIFSFTWAVDYLMATIGYLMFGNSVSDQVTKSIMLTEGQPKWIYFTICALMGLLPISKGPLILRPIITMVDQSTLDPDEKIRTRKRTILKTANHFAVTMIFFVTSLVLTNFGKIMSFLGSTICFSICIIYPLAFYLRLYYKELGNLSKMFIYAAIAFTALLAVAGTVAVVIS